MDRTLERYSQNKPRNHKSDNSFVMRLYIPPGGGGVTPYNGLYGEAPPERGTFFRLQVFKRVGISQAEVYKRVGKSVIRYLKGLLIIIFRIDAPYGCISLCLKPHMKMRTELPKVGM